MENRIRYRVTANDMRHPGTPAPRHPGTPAPRHPGTPAPRHPGTPAPRHPGTPAPRHPGTPAPRHPGTPLNSCPSTFSAACLWCGRTLLVLLAVLSAALRFVFATLKGWTRSRGAVYLFALVVLPTFNTEAQAQTAPEITSGGPFTVAEGTTAVATLTASDDDTASDQLAWSIPSGDAGGADADKFTLTSAGVLTFSAAKDYEAPADADADGSYEVTVEVSDGSDSDAADLVVTLENVVELTTLTGPSTVDYEENRAVRVATYSASSEADRDGLSWSLSGADADSFRIDEPAGVLRFDLAVVSPNLFSPPPDYDAPADDDSDGTYEVTVEVGDGVTRHSLAVEVTITDQDEAGTLTLSTTRPQFGVALTTTLTDPDGVSGMVTYRWERSAGRSAWTDIVVATASSYTLTSAETGHFLRVTATYTDGHGGGKTVTARTSEVVTADLLSGLTVSTTDSAANSGHAIRPSFDAGILHYSIGCAAAGETMTLTPTAGSGGRLSIDGTQVSSGESRTVAVDADSEVRVTVAGASGAATTYVVRCLSGDLLDMTVTTASGATGVIEDLIVFGVAQTTERSIAIVDSNGAVRFHRRDANWVGGYVRAAWVSAAGEYRYAYNAGAGQDWKILDQNLEVIDTVSTVAPLTNTDRHDITLLDDGNYIVMAYEPVDRDLSGLTFGNFSTSERVRDSALQIRTPAGASLFDWNSYDAIPLEDCKPQFPPGQADYAHVNTLQMVDGDIVASFRGCNSVLRIDPDDASSHKVVWRLGLTNLSDEQWDGLGKGPPPLEIIGDAEGQFCGQHGSSLLPNGHLILFDNGVQCMLDPWLDTQLLPRPGGKYSRAVEYALDVDNGEAVFLRDHSLGGTRSKAGNVHGHVEELEGGDWLIGWGEQGRRKPRKSVTQVDPDTGEEKFSIVLLQADGGSETIRPIPLPPVALADQPVPLRAEFPVSELTSAVHSGPMDSPKVLIAFNQPVVDATVAGSIDVTGAAVASVIPHLEAGAPANAYLVTLTPGGNGPIIFGLVTSRSCADGGVCTAAGGGLETVPAARQIPGPLTVSITSNTAPPANGAFTVTITFSRAVTGLMAGEVAVTHGTASNFRGTGASYTLDIAPNAGIEAAVTVRVPAGVAVDGANLGNIEGLGTFAVDTRAPRVLSITSGAADPTKDPFTVTITFSEAVMGLTAGEVAVANGTGSNLQGLGASYTLDIEPAADIEDDVTVRVPAGAARDAANNGNVEGSAAFRVDTRAPAWLSAAVNGNTLTLSYGEALDTSSRPAPGDFTVNVADVARSVSGVAVGGIAVTLTLDSAVADGEAVTVTYRPGTNPIRDAAGNAASGLGNAPVTNTTAAPNTDPTITSPGTFEVPENQARVSRLTAADADPGDEVTGYRLAGGADRAQFAIVEDTGELSFRVAPNFEAPTDAFSNDPPSAAGDNEYIVVVRVSSGAGDRDRTTDQAIRVRVSDVEEPPAAPGAPTFWGETPDSLTVGWTEPDNTGPPITGYDVQYRKGGSGGFTDAPPPGTARTATLTELSEATAYQVSVRARNEEGTGPWSEPGEGRTIDPLTVRMTTGLAPPVEGPFTLRFRFSEAVTGFTRGDIATQQEPPCTDTGNLPVPCTPSLAAFQTTDNQVFTTTVTPLTAGVAHNYTLTISVRANTVTSSLDNKPNEAATLAIRVAPPGVTVPISSLGMTASPGNGQVTLRWNAPENTGGAPIVRYEYRVAESGGEFSAWMRVDAAETSATAPDLTNGREYVFELRGVNPLGYGGVETVRATPATGGGGGGGGGGFGGGGGGPRTSAPGAPGNLTAVGGDGQAVLSWDAPASDGGAAITDYEYRINGQNPWISTGSTETTHTLTGLVNGTVYTFEVRAVNRIGKSFPSSQAESAPKAPEVFTLDFAHFANGNGTTSDLVFVNVASQPVRPALYFYDTEGDPMAAESVVDVTGDLEISEDGGLTVLTEMEPLGELTIPTHGQGELVSGSVKVISSAPVGTMLRFALPGIGETVVGASPPVSDTLFPVRRQEGGITTGVAIHNLEEEPMEVVCDLLREGVLLDSVSLPLEANGQSSWLIEAAFPGTDTSDFVGSVRCDAPAMFSAVALEMDPGTRVFLTLPLFPVNRRAGGRAAALDFAHFANGDGTTSDLVFVNLSTQRSRPAPTPFHTDIPPIRPAIYFYDTEGNPIAAESVVDLTGDLAIQEDGGLTVQTEMEPLGVLTISTHGQGALVSGSVKVVADGPIGGMLRFNLPHIGEAVVGASPPLGDALFPVRRREEGITTGVALHNLESSPGLVHCDLMQEGVLRDAASFPLAANGQTSWLIDQEFRGTDTSEFVGSVRCDAVGEGLFSAVALEMDPGTRVFTTLPVVPVPERMSQE